MKTVNIKVNINTTILYNTHLSSKSLVLYYVRSLCVMIFYPKLDHSEHNVIKSVNIKVSLNKTYRNHVKHTCEEKITSVLLYSDFYEAVHTISPWFKVFVPKVDHFEHTMSPRVSISKSAYK